MKKVIGYADYSVEVACPACGDSFDLIGTENDEDNVVTRPMFENTTESCTNMGIGIVCPGCESELVLDKIEY